jgi:uncharacterized protein (TIGR02145 family)
LLYGRNTGTFTVTRDGKTYKTVKIGNQLWMAENLNYDIGNGSWCYENNSAHCSRYGRLYNWVAANRVAPMGSHLPSKSEFEILLKFLAGEDTNMYGQIVSEDSSGFNALLSGSCGYKGAFGYIDSHAYFWSSTKRNFHTAWSLSVNSGNREILVENNFITYGLSIRLVKD